MPGASGPSMQAMMRAEEEQIQRLFNTHQGALQGLFTRLCNERRAWLEEAFAAEMKHSLEMTGEGVPKQTIHGGSSFVDVVLVGKSDSTVTGQGEDIDTSSLGRLCLASDDPRRDTNDIIDPTNPAASVTKEENKSCKEDTKNIREGSFSMPMQKLFSEQSADTPKHYEAYLANQRMMSNIKNHSVGAVMSTHLSKSFGFSLSLAQLENKTRSWSGYHPLRAFTDHSAFVLVVAAVVIFSLYVSAADVDRSVAQTLKGLSVNTVNNNTSNDNSSDNTTTNNKYIDSGNNDQRVIELCFSIFFFMELALRLVAEGVGFFLSEERAWNMFDFVLVATSLVWIVIDFLSTTGAITYVQSLRLVRLLRTLRVLRLIQAFRMLRLMVLSVIKSFWTVGWAFVLLFLFITTVSILLMQGIIMHSGVETDDDIRQDLTLLSKHFKGFGNTCLSLFMAVTGGVDYWQLAEPLFNHGSGLGVLFVAYVALMSIGILNIITGIFVQVAGALAAQDRVILTQSQMNANASLMRSLMKLFPELDKDGSDMITLEEFEACASDPHNAAYFTALGLDITKSKRFFNLIDLDGSGELTSEEFVMGCMRLQGHSKAIDFETLASENYKLSRRMKRVEKNLIHALEDIEKSLCEAVCFGRTRRVCTSYVGSSTIIRI
eukprot:TRINITY_DN252_c0_g2_i5.p1 TRINITY_DN252_c0_g2~~TRINITY_DN252_c0_g2_i5.p1  ORF type:complete len:660 (-),score=97.96 TRINITY_DN252_c0_g2_i5:64-2043(-)